MFSAFNSAENMIYNATDVPNLSKVTNMSLMFSGASSFNGDLSGWDVSNVTRMSSMFSGASSFNGDLSVWDVSIVTTMSSMFSGASSFNGDLSDWDVSNVTNMSSMFSRASSFNADLNGWDVSNVTNMSSMFQGVHSFNGDLSGWDVSNVTDMSSMFNEASSFNGDISGWDVSSVTDMGGMFNNLFNANGSSFNGDISGWEVSNVTDMRSMFRAADSFNGDLSGWDVSNVTNMSSMFNEASSFNGDISGWDVSSVTTMNSMFFGAVSFNGDISSWDVSSVTMNGMRWMFLSAESFNGDLSNWDISSVSDMSFMFDNSGLSTENYDKLLLSWAELTLQEDVQLGVSGLEYCQGAEARQYIIDTFNWTFEGDTDLDCVVTPVLISPASNSSQELPVTLQWEPLASEDDQLVVQVALDDGFDEIIVNEIYSYGESITQVTLSDLETNTVYYWRVRKERTYDSNKFSDWMTRQFYVQPDYISLQGDSIDVQEPNYVNIWLHALDANEKGITGLNKDSFELLENGNAISQTESNYQLSKMDEVPYVIKTVMMLDNSLSIGEDNLEFIKEAAKSFIQNMVPNQEVALYVFADGREQLLPFTSDANSLTNSIDNINLTNIPGTDLYSAAIEGLQQWNNDFSLTQITEGMMLLFTDGRDLAGRYTLADVLTARGDKQIYAVGVELDPNDFDEDALRQIGNGGTFIESGFEGLSNRFEDVQESIEQYSNSFYWLNYASASRSSDTELQIKVKDNTNTGADAEIIASFDASDFYAVPRDIIINGSAENPVGVDELSIGGDDTLEVEIETVFSYELEPFTFGISDSAKLRIEPHESKPFVFNFYADGEEGDQLEVVIKDTVQKTLNLQKTLTVHLTERDTPIGTSVEADELPIEFALQQNYPNPFNPTTNIKYDLPEATKIRLQVFDLLGRNVATLVNERKAAGRYSVRFEAGSLASGMYIYRIEAGNFTHTRKLMLIK
ncbi:MAG: BspA family leucine-rich repeat surface protein [Balneolaceae bacterium]